MPSRHVADFLAHGAARMSKHAIGLPENCLDLFGAEVPTFEICFETFPYFWVYELALVNEALFWFGVMTEELFSGIMIPLHNC